jgi:hypothetical protein
LIDYCHQEFKRCSLSKQQHMFLCSALQRIVDAIDPNDINVKDRHGYTLLHVAAMSDQEDIVQKLRQKGALHQMNNNGVWPLNLAMMQNRCKSFVAFLESGIPIPEHIDLDVQGKPIPFVVTCSTYCHSSVILGRVYDYYRDILDNTFTFSGENGEVTLRLLDEQHPYSRFELLKRGVKFIFNDENLHDTDVSAVNQDLSEQLQDLAI